MDISIHVLSNPTVDALQQRMAALDGGVGAVAFASGTAAIMGLIMTVCETGDEIIAANNLYGGTIWFTIRNNGRNGICFTFC